MEQIYYSKHFGHIDLSKIISVSDAWFSGGEYVGFNVLVQSREAPLKYKRVLTRNTELKWIPGLPHINEGHNVIKTIDGKWKRNMKINIDNDYTVAQANLQEEIDDLINAWESYCTGHAVSQLSRPACNQRTKYCY